MPWRFRAETDRKLPGEAPLVRKLLGLEPAGGSESSATAAEVVALAVAATVAAATVDVENRRRKPTGCGKSASETRIRRSFDLR